MALLRVLLPILHQADLHNGCQRLWLADPHPFDVGEVWHARVQDLPSCYVCDSSISLSIADRPLHSLERDRQFDQAGIASQVHRHGSSLFDRRVFVRCKNSGALASGQMWHLVSESSTVPSFGGGSSLRPLWWNFRDGSASSPDGTALSDHESGSIRPIKTVFDFTSFLMRQFSSNSWLWKTLKRIKKIAITEEEKYHYYNNQPALLITIMS